MAGPDARSRQFSVHGAVAETAHRVRRTARTARRVPRYHRSAARPRARCACAARWNGGCAATGSGGVARLVRSARDARGDRRCQRRVASRNSAPDVVPVGTRHAGECRAFVAPVAVGAIGSRSAQGAAVGTRCGETQRPLDVPPSRRVAGPGPEHARATRNRAGPGHRTPAAVAQLVGQTDHGRAPWRRRWNCSARHRSFACRPFRRQARSPVAAGPGAEIPKYGVPARIAPGHAPRGGTGSSGRRAARPTALCTGGEGGAPRRIARVRSAVQSRTQGREVHSGHEWCFSLS